MSAIDTLDLTILDAGSKQAVTLARSGFDIAVAKIPFGEDLAKLAGFRKRLEDAVKGVQPAPSQAEMKAFGEALFRFVVRDDVDDLYNRLPATRVSVHVLSTSPELQALPWEYLKEPKQPRAPRRERCVVRIVPMIGRAPAEPAPLTGELRLLFVSADPVDQQGVSSEDIRRRIERLLRARLPERFADPTVISSADRQTLKKTIRNSEFDIFHFSGHGEIGPNGEGRLVLMNPKTGKSDYLPGEDLASILSGKNIRLAVLSACSTAQGSKTSTTASASASVRAGEAMRPDQSASATTVTIQNVRCAGTAKPASSV